ncbi:MAG: DUF4303 domain-containing protein [Nocardioides sp.]|uniref:DUF4303 domain-containing protein n=1 Tax=Nocardioides sp. TaxID=35761 RepID=UPI0039E2397B
MRPRSDPDLSRALASAAGAAIATLREQHPQRFYAVALLTSGEARAPYLSACSLEADAAEGLERWDLAGTPYATWGYDEHFAGVSRALAARGELSGLGGDAFEAEYALRLASIEEALRLLDVAGLFGAGAERQGVLLIAGTVPPDATDAGFVRRLNPAGPLYEEWLRECAEQPALRPGSPSSASEETAPNPTVAELWRTTADLSLPDGITVYGPDDIEERNETYEVAEYAPGWSLVGDDSGGRGLLMRATGPGFDPARGRDAAEVFLLDLGALREDVPGEGEFVTDDLIGWLAARQRDAGGGGAR